MADSIYLLDAFHYVFRAYYAVERLTTPDGIPTHATFGFVRMLLKSMRDKKMKHLGVFFDRPEPTFRKDLYPEYKANRSAAPEDLVPQFDWIKRIVTNLHLPMIEQAGYEADDLIGTAAHRFAESGQDVVIVSGDKDLMQLVTDKVRIWDPMKDREFGIEGVHERFGVRPDQVVDVLALAGDASDNIPGIRGIGEKTATQWIQTYGSLDALYEHVDQISGKRGEWLRDQKDAAYLSKKLATIYCEVPHPFTLEELLIREPNWEALKADFTRLGFSRLWKDVEALHGRDPRENPPHEERNGEKTIASDSGHVSQLEISSQHESPSQLSDVPNAEALYASGAYRVIQTFEDLAKLLQDLDQVSLFAFDTETTGLNPLTSDWVGLSLAYREHEAVYIPIAHTTNDTQLDRAVVITCLKPYFENPKWKKVGQNLKYDLHVLHEAGISVSGVCADTMIASYLLDPESTHNLDDLAARYLGYRTLKFEDVAGKGSSALNFSQVPIVRATPYAAQDADVALRLYHALMPLLEARAMDRLFFDLEMPIVGCLRKMERTGIRIDVLKMESLSRRFEMRAHELEGLIHKAAGQPFNTQSPKQLAFILFEKLGLPVIRKTKTGFSTDSDVLETLARDHHAEIASNLILFRQMMKLKSTYVDKLPALINPKTGRLHTHFNQAVTATGRLSSTDPNLQNIPINGEEGGHIRDAFIADPGHVLLSLDYSQIELRILAEFSKDPHLIAAFQNNGDPHRETASRIFEVPIAEVSSDQRRVGKTINFATLYGQGPFSLSAQLRIPLADAKRYIARYFEEFSHIKTYRESVLDRAKELGYVQTYLGHRRYFPDLHSRNKTLVLAAERMAFNAVIQGSAADLVKKAMLKTDALIQSDPSARLLLQVHDELVFEVAASHAARLAEELKRAMEGVAPDFLVPLTVQYGYGPTWSTAHA